MRERKNERERERETDASIKLSGLLPCRLIISLSLILQYFFQNQSKNNWKLDTIDYISLDMTLTKFIRPLKPVCTSLARWIRPPCKVTDRWVINIRKRGSWGTNRHRLGIGLLYRGHK